ncbi:MAG TPA: PPK2 family polyphosphate kinase [Ilumatobacter sp.]|nr:PPK2 family polyphosphate kinase [Ilumatobacter sp.]
MSRHPADKIAELWSPGSVSAELRAPTVGEPLVLDGFRTDATPLVHDRSAAEEELVDHQSTLDDLHDRLMAESRHSVLVILQGLDGSGKSGTIKHVGRRLNPVGISVACFKEPDAKEQAEPFLARIRRELPDPGHITFFDRSHYEDIIVPDALDKMSDKDLTKRIKDIVAFEEKLIQSGTVIVKCLLHISFDEQRERFLRRLRRPDKQWKFAESDLDTRADWARFQSAYGAAIGRTSTELSPWHIVPADHKWYRNWAIASLMYEHLAHLRSEYPPLDGDAEHFRAQLESPN